MFQPVCPIQCRWSKTSVPQAGSSWTFEKNGLLCNGGHGYASGGHSGSFLEGVVKD